MEENKQKKFIKNWNRAGESKDKFQSHRVDICFDFNLYLNTNLHEKAM